MIAYTWPPDQCPIHDHPWFFALSHTTTGCRCPPPYESTRIFDLPKAEPAEAKPGKPLPYYRRFERKRRAR